MRTEAITLRALHKKFSKYFPSTPQQTEGLKITYFGIIKNLRYNLKIHELGITQDTSHRCNVPE